MVEQRTHREYDIPAVHLPGLYRSAGLAALKAQTTYERLLKVVLAAVTVGSLLGAVAEAIPSYHSQLRFSSAAVLGIGLLILLIIRISRLQMRGFAAYALAVSVKSLAWKYMAKAPPFQPGISNFEVDNRFRVLMSSLISSAEVLDPGLRKPQPSSTDITDRMRQVRGLHVEARKATYFVGRVEKQKLLQQRTAHTSRRLVTTFTALAAITLAAAAAASLYQSVYSGMPGSVASGIATLSIVFIGWISIKQAPLRNSESTLAAHELGLIAGREPFIHTESELSLLVADAEAAIDKIHTIWAAHRSYV